VRPIAEVVEEATLLAHISGCHWFLVCTASPDAGLEVVVSWHAGGRWFAQIKHPPGRMGKEA